VAGYNSASGYLNSAELYDPASGTWSASGSLAVAREAHTATLWPNGKLLAAGGGIGVYALSMAELYNAAPGGFTPSIFELLLE
jgi:hypothetical protein